MWWIYLIVFIIIMVILQEYIGVILCIAAVIASIYFLGFFTTLKIAIGIFIALAVFGYVINYIERQNVKKLNEYLESNCMKWGYVNESLWKKRLPQFVDKRYPSDTSFEKITQEFAKSIEKKYIDGDESLSWLNPIVRYLINNVMRDIDELMEVPSEGLKYTHCTADKILIVNAMDMLCKGKRLEGKKVYEKIMLNDGREAYKLTDYYRDKRKNSVESNFESEEFTIDEL